ncbi:SusE domain-containing protein [Hufsiella ginkgonis]|uniref:SusE outer membrane protein domain-containing protein n=1 Tax=Hufsiella ginkgonis TaxID=2695274 RepID=A0A7K1XXV9_9SPHI|nr:SusE domain-containing protein [Hufsiella ginkgonis]MXV15773.1 hypothetical protein [Hufsiella ginkgonis]
MNTIPFFDKTAGISGSGLFRTCTFSIMLCFFIMGCDKTLDAPEPAPLETGTFSASKTAVEVDLTKPTAEAVKFTWTAVPNSLVRYSLILSSGTKTDTTVIAQNALTKSYTNAELNAILVTKLGLAANTEKDIQAVVKAKVSINDKTALSNALTVKVIPK